MNNTEVVFENIERRILKEIDEAKYAVFVSVAWFTNKKLFEALLKKAQGNCYVSIIIQLDEINTNSGIEYQSINIGRSECFFIPKEADLLHDKYCVIDFQKVITGSYNWTYKAIHNSENVMIVTDAGIASQYISRFEQQKQNHQITDSPQRLKLQKTELTAKETASSVVVKIDNTIKKNKVCPKCGYEINEMDNYCGICGIYLKGPKYQHKLKCSTCNREQPELFIDSQCKYCIFCGSKTLTISANTKLN